MNSLYNLLMNRCYELAAKGRGNTKSNPMVGALLYFNNRIIGEGYHKEFGKEHAEVNCIASVSKDNRQNISNSTLFISLEPCTHYGKTPPCVSLIMNYNIKKVVIGTTDVNPIVSNEGIDILKKRGIEVINLNWDSKQKTLNKVYWVNQVYNKPYIIAKYAQSQDFNISNRGEKTKITTKELDIYMHKLRSEVDAIIIGKNTFLIDKPILNSRLYIDKNPLVIVFDHNPIVDIYSYWQGRDVYIFNEIIDQIIGSLHFIKCDSIMDYTEIEKKLIGLNISYCLVEGGAELLQFFDRNNALDEVIELTNKSLLLENGVPSPHLISNQYYCNDLLSLEQIELKILYNKRMKL